mmetsp:Transcript_10284/g.15565  ORF Transcript_10284/g.15565 Transcript_10284/m.15565 type:complete len:146 (+) Transcript_10284:40-477(+)
MDSVDFSSLEGTQFIRIFVRVDIMCQKLVVAKDALLQLVKNDPRWQYHTFALTGTRIITHVAHVPEGQGFVPPAPMCATDEFGRAQMSPPRERRSRAKRKAISPCVVDLWKPKHKQQCRVQKTSKEVAELEAEIAVLKNDLLKAK